MGIRFGTDGWRAVIADEFTFAAVNRIARAYGAVLRQQITSRRPRVVVGFDRRFASDGAARAAASALAVQGLDVWLASGPVPTPAVSWAVVEQGADGAVMITASHNPHPFNGVKLKTAAGASAPPDLIRAVEQHLSEGSAGDATDDPGEVTELDVIPGYLERLRRMAAVARIQGAALTVAADAMFGPTAGLLARLVGGDATEVVELNTAHNPLFPGISGPEPVEKNLARLKKVVSDGGAHAGFAFDGDGDRMALIDEQGRYVSAQHTLALLARYVLSVRRERKPLVRSVTGSGMLDRLAARAGVPVYETPTGFSHISQAMLDRGAAFGGEESGGFAFAFHLPERDGLLAALLLLDALVTSGERVSDLLDDLAQEVGTWAYRRLDIPLPAAARATVLRRLGELEVPGALAGQAVQDVRHLDGTKVRLADGSWLLLRASGTEPLVRIMAEAPEAEQVDQILLAGRGLLGV